MKKFFAFILSLALLLCLASCEEKTPAGTGEGADTPGKKEFVYGADGITKIYSDENGKTLREEDSFYKTVYEYGEGGLLSKLSRFELYGAEPFEYRLYEYDGEGALIKESYYHTGKLREYTLYENGEGGRAQSYTLYGRTNAFTDDFAIQRTTVCEYGEGGLLLKEESFSGDGEPLESISYTYTAEGKTKLTSCGGRNMRTEKYDSAGNLTLEETASCKTVYEYGKDGKLASIQIQQKSPVKSESRSDFIYDKDGRRTGETLTLSEGGRTTLTSYTLHGNGRYAEAKTYDTGLGGGKVLIKHTLYNANGVNAEKEIFYNSDGTKARMVEYNGATVIKITIYHADGTVSTAIP